MEEGELRDLAHLLYLAYWAVTQRKFHFNSWGEAVKAAGCNLPIPPRTRRRSPEAIIGIILRAKKNRLGLDPSSVRTQWLAMQEGELRDLAYLLYLAYLEITTKSGLYFGSWEEVVEIAGRNLPRQPRTRIRSWEGIVRVIRRAQEKGLGLDSHSVRTQWIAMQEGELRDLAYLLYLAYFAILTRPGLYFGSWEEVLAAAGIHTLQFEGATAPKPEPADVPLTKLEEIATLIDHKEGDIVVYYPGSGGHIVVRETNGTDFVYVDLLVGYTGGIEGVLRRMREEVEEIGGTDFKIAYDPGVHQKLYISFNYRHPMDTLPKTRRVVFYGGRQAFTFRPDELLNGYDIFVTRGQAAEGSSTYFNTPEVQLWQLTLMRRGGYFLGEEDITACIDPAWIGFASIAKDLIARWKHLYRKEIEVEPGLMRDLLELDWILKESWIFRHSGTVEKIQQEAYWQEYRRLLEALRAIYNRLPSCLQPQVIALLSEKHRVDKADYWYRPLFRGYLERARRLIKGSPQEIQGELEWARRQNTPGLNRYCQPASILTDALRIAGREKEEAFFREVFSSLTPRNFSLTHLTSFVNNPPAGGKGDGSNCANGRANGDGYDLLRGTPPVSPRNFSLTHLRSFVNDPPAGIDIVLWKRRLAITEALYAALGLNPDESLAVFNITTNEISYSGRIRGPDNQISFEIIRKLLPTYTELEVNDLIKLIQNHEKAHQANPKEECEYQIFLIQAEEEANSMVATLRKIAETLRAEEIKLTPEFFTLAKNNLALISRKLRNAPIAKKQIDAILGQIKNPGMLNQSMRKGIAEMIDTAIRLIGVILLLILFINASGSLYNLLGLFALCGICLVSGHLARNERGELSAFSFKIGPVGEAMRDTEAFFASILSAKVIAIDWCGTIIPMVFPSDIRLTEKLHGILETMQFLLFINPELIIVIVSDSGVPLEEVLASYPDLIGLKEEFKHGKRLVVLERQDDKAAAVKSFLKESNLPDDVSLKDVSVLSLSAAPIIGSRLLGRSIRAVAFPCRAQELHKLEKEIRALSAQEWPYYMAQLSVRAHRTLREKIKKIEELYRILSLSSLPETFASFKREIDKLFSLSVSTGAFWDDLSGLETLDMNKVNAIIAALLRFVSDAAAIYRGPYHESNLLFHLFFSRVSLETPWLTASLDSQRTLNEMYGLAYELDYLLKQLPCLFLHGDEMRNHWRVRLVRGDYLQFVLSSVIASVKTIEYVSRQEGAIEHRESALIEAELDMPDRMPDLIGDLSLIVLALEEVIKNAVVQFLENHCLSPRILISVRIKKRQISISISDNAGGIDEAFSPRIFDVAVTNAPERRMDFYYMQDLINFLEHGRTEVLVGYGGLGLGLSKARWISEFHGGAISVVNNDAGGATVTIDLPIVQRDEEGK
ncbi:MAG: ATP-binding protein [Candidatus Omnitrophota bacterium]